MPKYRVIRDKYERYSSGGIIASTFTAKDDVEAILKVDEHCSYGYYDEEERSYEDEGFVAPTLQKAIDHLAMSNGDGADYVFKIENLDIGSVIFEDDDQYIEDEEDW